MAKQPTAAGRVTHFGQFVRWHRVNAGKTADAYARELGLTGRRLFAIEAMAAPAVQHTTLSAIARSMGLSMEALDRAWRSTPVPLTHRRSGPTTDGASRFAAACAAVGIDPPEGLRRLRRWLIDQPADVQRAALSTPPRTVPTPPTFTVPVDHLQDPAAAQAERIAARANAAPPRPQQQQQQKRPPPPKSPPPPSPKPRPAGGGRPGASPARSPGPAATGGSRRR